jgi:hypothetical protein
VIDVGLVVLGVAGLTVGVAVVLALVIHEVCWRWSSRYARRRPEVLDLTLSGVTPQEPWRS